VEEKRQAKSRKKKQQKNQGYSFQETNHNAIEQVCGSL